MITQVNDSLVSGEDDDDQLRNLEEVLKCLVKKQSCGYATSSDTSGHKMSKEGIQPIHDKIEKMRKAPPSNVVSELMSSKGFII